MNVVIEEGDFQGTCDISQVKHELSELEDIIMEGDIILKVHADGENDENSQKEYHQAMPPECAEHANLMLFEDEALVNVGDRFQSNKAFVVYVNENAKRWCFYYKCTEAKNVDTENEEYTYCCVYLKNRDYPRKNVSKKRYNCKTDCPCKVKLRRRPGEDLTVVYVCNHHDHDLSKKDFFKLQNNKKLPPYIKEIIMDLMALGADIPKIRKFVEMETGIKMSKNFFYDLDKKMKLSTEGRQISDKRLKELSDIMSGFDEMYSGDEDDSYEVQTQSKNKRPKLAVAKGGIIANLKFEEDIESARNLQLTINTSDANWISDQATVETNRTEWDETTMTAANEKSNILTKNDNQEYEATETLDTDYTDDFTVEETAPDTATPEQNDTENLQYENIVFQDEFGNIINPENGEQIVILQQDENGMVQGENGTIGYFDGEKIIYLDPNQQTEQAEQTEQIEGNKSLNSCEAAVQANAKPGSSCVPVFDIYMKNGNVTGFVVNDNVDNEEQTHTKSPNKSSRSNNFTPNISQISSIAEPSGNASTSNATQEFVYGDTYTKHEYIHRYNIDRYMANPQFPKYIDTLAKKTRTDVIQMLARVYNEKAMFKMTTTQKGKEGNTKIWYLTDVRRKQKYKMSDEEKMKRDKIGQYITDILLLKERVKTLKKDNEELVTRNKYLEEVALRLAKMNEHN